MIIHYGVDGTVTFDPPLRKYRSLKLIDRATGEVHDRSDAKLTYTDLIYMVVSEDSDGQHTLEQFSAHAYAIEIEDDRARLHSLITEMENAEGSGEAV